MALAGLSRSLIAHSCILRSAAKHHFQLYLRRPPPANEPSELERILEAELAIGADMRSLSRSVLALVAEGGNDGLVRSIIF